ncbi:MAG: complex I NDUFA9 subunit family protein [Burkholderiales bacterium]|nr:complex I NDUFA9 subunit family protein [Burkholderiales bacterium]
MTLRSVCLIGGSGFVGSHVARQLSARGIHVRIPTRIRERVKDELILLPTVDVQQADIHDPPSLARLVTGVDAVVNLVGVLHDGRGDGFRRNHEELPARIAAACREAGVRRLVHVSALGASADAPSAYLRSKAVGEIAVKNAADRLPATILRPSVIFGRGDSFLTLFAQLARIAPVLPLGGANARFQPIHVEDVARAIVHCLDNRDTIGQTYPLCGPTIYTLHELVRYVCALLQLRRAIVPLPRPLAHLQAFALEHLPGRLMTRDNLRSMQVDNVCGCAFPPVFDFAPAPLETVAPLYLAEQTPRTRYGSFRFRAGR